jgi:hypothetical protein
MVELNKVEEIIWGIIEENHVGKTDAISQEELLNEVNFFDHFNAPKSLRGLRNIMRELKTKRPVLFSREDKPGYHKPANWDEVRACLGRRKYSLIRQYRLNAKVLSVCKEYIPHKEGEQLKLFSDEMIKEFPELAYLE